MLKLILNQIILLILTKVMIEANGENDFLTKKIFNKLDGLAHIWSSALPENTTLEERTTALPKSNLNIFNEFSEMNNNDLLILSSTTSKSNTNTNNLNEPSQIVLFNIGDTRRNEFLKEKNTFRLDFDQESINYCHFDPLLLSNKRRHPQTNSYRDDEDDHEHLVGFNLNVYFNGDYFNETSKITGNNE